MTIETAFFSKVTSHVSITALVGTRIYPLVAPYTPTYPHVVFTVFGEGHDHSLNGATGLVDLTLQVDVWASSITSRVAIADAFRNELDGFSGAMGSENLDVRSCNLENREQFFEKDTEGGNTFYRSSMDFKIWHREALPTL